MRGVPALRAMLEPYSKYVDRCELPELNEPLDVNRSAYADIKLDPFVRASLVRFFLSAPDDRLLESESDYHRARTMFVRNAIVSLAVASQTTLKTLGLGYALWALIVGLFISNALRVPGWLKPAIQSDLYIKIGLVLLGGEILFGEMLALGGGTEHNRRTLDDTARELEETLLQHGVDARLTRIGSR